MVKIIKKIWNKILGISLVYIILAVTFLYLYVSRYGWESLYQNILIWGIGFTLFFGLGVVVTLFAKEFSKIRRKLF